MECWMCGAWTVEIWFRDGDLWVGGSPALIGLAGDESDGLLPRLICMYCRLELVRGRTTGKI